MAEHLGTWVYCVTRQLRDEHLALLTGVDREPVRSVKGPDLAAVVGSVDLQEFGEEPLRRNLENLSWLDNCARSHHRVIQAVARSGPVVPMRLAVVFHDDTRVGTMLEERTDDLASALSRIDGRAEWGVKAFSDAGASEEGSDTASDELDRGPGTAYLRRRRAQLSAHERARNAAAMGAEAVHKALSAISDAASRHPPQDERLRGDPSWMILNGAYLVEDNRVDQFVETARALDDEHPGLRLELTGPWPPYSFATVEERGF